MSPANRSRTHTPAAPKIDLPRRAPRRSRDQRRQRAAVRRRDALQRAQKASSSETLVRWPAMASERFLTPAGAVRAGVGGSRHSGASRRLQPMRVETGALQPRLGLAQLALELRAAKGDAIGVRLFLADALVAVLARAAEIDRPRPSRQILRSFCGKRRSRRSCRRRPSPAPGGRRRAFGFRRGGRRRGLDSRLRAHEARAGAL